MYDKKKLEEKVQQLTQERQMAMAEAEKFTILVHKYNGAIEAIELLIKEIKEEKP